MTAAVTASRRSPLELISRRLRPVARILSDDKVVDSRLLNAMGAQPLRALAARTVYTLRPVKTDDAVRSAVDELKSEGLLLWRNFLPSEHFEGVLQECAHLDATTSPGASVSRVLTNKQGLTVREVVRIRQFEERELPQIYRFFSDPRLSAILEAAERRPHRNLVRDGNRERLLHGPIDGQSEVQEDPQSRLHSDVFFHSHKIWFFLDDVQVEDGPLVYVKRSHRVSLSRLRFIYRDSCRRDPAVDPSRRISREEQERTALTETTVTCPRNTLVIANVCGYHRRLQGEVGRQRHALFLSVRTNPFFRERG